MYPCIVTTAHFRRRSRPCSWVPFCWRSFSFFSRSSRAASAAISPSTALRSVCSSVSTTSLVLSSMACGISIGIFILSARRSTSLICSLMRFCRSCLSRTSSGVSGCSSTRRMRSSLSATLLMIVASHLVRQMTVCSSSTRTSFSSFAFWFCSLLRAAICPLRMRMAFCCSAVCSSCSVSRSCLSLRCTYHSLSCALKTSSLMRLRSASCCMACSMASMRSRCSSARVTRTRLMYLRQYIWMPISAMACLQ
mmetsp:Transcript_4880/g.10636  ORF Transcript_4880/g.10636 Transcript_4880/m.10636 type:complete len:251 (-) Transcript_4880:360-1112(-)